MIPVAQDPVLDELAVSSDVPVFHIIKPVFSNLRKAFGVVLRDIVWEPLLPGFEQLPLQPFQDRFICQGEIDVETLVRCLLENEV